MTPTLPLATLLSRAPSIGLGAWPTPIDNIARRGNADLLVKRDDLSGHGRGGAKARKIDHLVGHLVREGHDELIAVAGNVTNLAFDLLPVLRARGIRARLFILDDPPALARDREQIFEAVRDQVELIGRGRVMALAIMARAYLRARRDGRKPFIALPGASHPSGVIGNARGFVEMVLQRSEAREPLPSTVFVTAATGTTVAGFVLAEHALRAAGFSPIRVVGVQVYPGRIRERTLALLRWTERFLGLGTRVPRSRVDIVSSFLNGGFGCYTGELSRLCARVEHDAGIRIDPIFGAKTWSAMEHHLATARDRRPTLYWHCGYTPEWQLLGRAVMRRRGAL